jgi:hypothetical protein
VALRRIYEVRRLRVEGFFSPAAFVFTRVVNVRSSLLIGRRIVSRE